MGLSKSTGRENGTTLTKLKRYCDATELRTTQWYLKSFLGNEQSIVINKVTWEPLRTPGIIFAEKVWAYCERRNQPKRRYVKRTFWVREIRIS